MPPPLEPRLSAAADGKRLGDASAHRRSGRARQTLRQSGTSPRRARATAKRAARYASGTCGARIASITDSWARNGGPAARWSRSSPATENGTTIRRPGRGYGIHVSACVQARSDAASSAGQTDGIRNPTATARAAGCRPEDRHGRRAIEHRPTGQRGGRHRQREHAGGIHRLARGKVAVEPEGEHREEIGERRRQGHDHHERKTLGAIQIDRLPGQDQELDRSRERSGSEASAISPQRCRCRNSQAMARAGERMRYAAAAGADVPT